MPYNPNSIWGSRGGPTPPDAVPSQPDANPAAPQEPSPAPARPSPLWKSGPSDPSFFKKHGLMVFTIAISAMIAVAAVIYYLLLPPATPNIQITFSNPGTITVGKPFPLTVTVSNDSKSAIQGAELTVTLPQGLSFIASGTTPGERALMMSVGTLSAATINPPQTVEIVATGDSGTSQTVSAALTYGTSATAETEFASNGQISLTIGTQSALTLSYNAPSSIYSGQDFPLTVDYANTTDDTLTGVELVMQYPPAYHYTSASGSAPVDPADTTFDLGDLAPNATGSLVITGNIVGPNQAQYQLVGALGASYNGENYPSVSAPADFAIAPSPLSFAIALNNSSTYIAGLDDDLNYTLTYTNNSNVAFQMVSISAVLTGAMYNLSSLKTNGSFSSQNNTITWITANTPQLASIDPGQSGSVQFTINTKDTFPITLPSDENFGLSVNATIQSPTVPPNTEGSSTVSVASLATKMAGVIDLTADGFEKETLAPGIANSGPYPPIVNQPTTYTIHWTITNYATDMKNVTVSAYLQSGTTFTGQAWSNLGSSSTPFYNAATDLVTWTIPDVPATTGVISTPDEAVFQVSNTPAVNQVGQAVTLMGASTLTATDGFTGAAVTESTDPVMTNLPDDPSLKNQTGDVQN